MASIIVSYQASLAMAPLESSSVAKRRRSSTILDNKVSFDMDQASGGPSYPLYTTRVGSLDSMYENDSDDVSSTCSPTNLMSPVTPGKVKFGGGYPSGAASISNDALPMYWGSHSNNNHNNNGHLTIPLQDDGYEPLRGETQFVFTARKRKNPFYFAVLLFAAFGLFLYSKSHATLHNALEQVRRLTEQQKQVHSTFAKMENDIRKWHKQMVELGAEDNEGVSLTSNPVDKGNVVDEMMALQEKLREGNSQISNLQKHVQDVSKRDAMAKYGAGVIRVELQLEFPDGKEGPSSIVMEMAPLDLMPHSVYMFLEMVNFGLFDGCSFILNAMHVIKAAPLPYDGSSASAKVKAFTKRGLESVAFREYSPDYPHEKYTVGFAADGSPSFYINTQDNTDIHVGDPCFAKIVSGHDTVKRLEQAPTRNGIWYRQRIGLKRAQIL